MGKGDAVSLTLLSLAGLGVGSVWLWRRPVVVTIPPAPYVKPIYGADEALRLWAR